MEDFTKQIFPEGEERWIKVRYTDTKKASNNLKLNSPYHEKTYDPGFEVTAIGLRDEYIPQVETLLEIKEHLGSDYRFFENYELLNYFNEVFDVKVKELLDKVILSKQK